MKRTIVLLIVIAIFVCMCACQKTPAASPEITQATTIPTQTQQPTDPAPTQTQQPADPIPMQTQPTEPEDPRIAEFQDLLGWNGLESFYNAALLSEYSTPANVNLFYLFYDGFRDQPQKPTDEELVLLEGKMGEFWKEMDLFRIPVGKMDTVLTQLFGITLDQTNGVGLESFVYLEETDCYYTAHTGPYGAEITVKQVDDQTDGSVLVLYSVRYDGEYIVKLIPVEDGHYQILSNMKV